MLTKVRIKNLKRLDAAEIPLDDTIILAGPNNFGKTTALQALSLWSLAYRRWREVRGAGSKATERTGVPITRKDFNAVPVRSMDLLWTHRAVGKKKNEARPPVIEVVVEGVDGGATWKAGMELQYANPEMVYCRPIEGMPLPDEAALVTIVHVPPLGGIQTEEEKREPGIQDRIIGEGRPGEIVRNLLLNVSTQRPHAWKELCGQVHELFQLDLVEPSFSGTYITCEYRSRKGKALDIANAGSGFLQVLLLLAFFYARPGSVLLLDEPDAHLHVILQRDVYALLRRVASEAKAQLVISTHSEVLLDETDPTHIVAFSGEKPHRLVNTSQRSQLKKALDKLKSLDFLLADDVGAVLYTEGETDAGLLREWAQVLDHPALAYLERPFLHPLGGNAWPEAPEHFYALRDAFPKLRGAAVIDRPPKPVDDPSIAVHVWRRREIENYLLVPAAIRRFIQSRSPGPLFDRLAAERAQVVDRAFAKQVPTGFDPFDDSVVFLRDVKASDDFLLPLLGDCGLSTSKKDLFLIAAQMRPEEIHPEIKEALDVVATLSPPPTGDSAEVPDA